MEQLAKAYGLGAQAAVIRQHALPAIALVSADAGNSRSRLGGSPQGFEWPTYVPTQLKVMPPTLLDGLSGFQPTARALQTRLRRYSPPGRAARFFSVNRTATAQRRRT